MKYCRFCGTALKDGELCNCEEARADRIAYTQMEGRPGNQQTGPYRRNITRSIPMQILLSLVTCGIYYIYWQYCVLADLYSLSDEQNLALSDVILNIVTLGFFSFYVYYKVGVMLQRIRMRYDLLPRDDAVLFVLFAGFRMSIVGDVIIQQMQNSEIAPALERQ